ncbi:hypothetical protein GmHk_15G045143 [Glycine max]|nr:hypothetical protein GmHk_15G045143 [Glycine max]
MLVRSLSTLHNPGEDVCGWVRPLEGMTSSIHQPVEEMTITFDDVSSSLHFPVIGTLIAHPLTIDRDMKRLLPLIELNIPMEQKANVSTRVGTMSLMHVHISYHWYLNNLSICHHHAWRIATLVYLYNHFSYASLIDYDHQELLVVIWNLLKCICNGDGTRE